MIHIGKTLPFSVGSLSPQGDVVVPSSDGEDIATRCKVYSPQSVGEGLLGESRLGPGTSYPRGTLPNKDCAILGTTDDGMHGNTDVRGPSNVPDPIRVP